MNKNTNDILHCYPEHRAHWARCGTVQTLQGLGRDGRETMKKKLGKLDGKDAGRKRINI